MNATMALQARTAVRSGLRWIPVALLLWAAGGAVRAAGIEVTGAWARATMPGQKVAGVYMDIRSDRAARLVGVESPAAESAEVHEMRHQDGVMRMRHIEALDLPAGEVVKLAPGGYHVMLFDIRQALQPGDQVQLTLQVERGGKRESVPVVAVVKVPGASPAGGQSNH